MSGNVDRLFNYLGHISPVPLIPELDWCYIIISENALIFDVQKKKNLWAHTSESPAPMKFGLHLRNGKFQNCAIRRIKAYGEE